MRALALTPLALALVACGPPRPTTDGGSIDTSCGLDCVAQKTFGLVVNRCFEYSASETTPNDPPALGVFVKPVFTLEGGVQVLPVDYRTGGQTRMTDNFAFGADGSLKLMRREFPQQGQSITFRNDAMAITGVTWLLADVGPGQSQTTSSQAFIVNQSGAGMSEPTTYRVSTTTATPNQLRTPAATYTDGLNVLTTQSPTDRGADPRRVFVREVGFITIVSPFNIAGGNPPTLYLQRIRDVGTPDGGTEPCSTGVP
ncbi:MAG: hypothetical protein MUC96_36970 [Myxococcaceae bacterium]|jgi:hypothetical protein|nr:hypothetical protein [Myxococcaceae bacterium]